MLTGVGALLMLPRLSEIVLVRARPFAAFQRRVVSMSDSRVEVQEVLKTQASQLNEVCQVKRTHLPSWQHLDSKRDRP